MRVSIVIPTYNRSQMLCKTLENIISFEHQYHELIVVDQTKEHDPHTRQYLDNLIAQKKINYIFVELPSAPNAKNVGIEKACGDIVVCFDDDVEINENTIPAHVSGLSQPGVGCVTGKVIIENVNQDGNKVLKKRSSLQKFIKSFLFLFLRRKASYVGRLGVLANFTGNKILPSDTCIGCNMSFRKEVFKECSLFDVKFSGNAVREETDLSVRLRRCGYRIMYIPQASVIHYMNNTGGTRAAANEAYWFAIFRNQCYFYLKNFDYSRLTIMFVQIFDFSRCRRQGLKVMSIFRKAYKAAYTEARS
jgi:GT2 family glycosyltransferase